MAAQMQYIPQAYRIVWNAAGWYIVFWFAATIVSGLLPPLSITFTRRLVNEIVGEISAGAFNPPVLANAALPLGFIIVGQFILNTLRGWIGLIQGDLVNDHISALIQKKAISLDLSYFESSEYYNKLHLASTDARSRPMQIIQSVGSLISQGINLVVTAIILASFSSWIMPVLFLSMLPILVVVMRHNRAYVKWLRKNAPDQRRAVYYDNLLTDRAAAAEVRTLNIGELYHQKFLDIRQRIRKERLILEQKQTIANLFASSISVLAGIGTLAWMALRVWQGIATLGDLAAFYQALQQGQNAVRGLQGQFTSTVGSLLSLQNLFEFLALEPILQNSPKYPMLKLPLKQGIEFENVTFMYPGSNRPALQNFTWHIPAGETVALVGANGTGKSTLIKLLCRLYDPSEGAVLWDGVDIRDLPLEDIRSAVNILFQEPYRYYETVSQIITMGDPTPALDLGSVANAAETSGADEVVNQLPDQYETILGKQFGGTELSAGQWQRLALARSVYHKRPILVLDEPTSNVDSWAENLWIERLHQFRANKTILLITHRLSSTKPVDRIAVIHNHKIVEEGNHDYLMALGGRYCTAWNRQLSDQNTGPISPSTEYF